MSWAEAKWVKDQVTDWIRGSFAKEVLIPSDEVQEELVSAEVTTSGATPLLLGTFTAPVSGTVRIRATAASKSSNGAANVGISNVTVASSSEFLSNTVYVTGEKNTSYQDLVLEAQVYGGETYYLYLYIGNTSGGKCSSCKVCWEIAYRRENLICGGVEGSVSLPSNGSTATLLNLTGHGWVDVFCVTGNGYSALQIEIDGVTKNTGSISSSNIFCMNFGNSIGFGSIGKTASVTYQYQIPVRIPFRESLKISAVNSTAYGSDTVSYNICYFVTQN